MRTLTTLLAAAATLIPAPALAKGPAMTWEVSPEQPVAGEPATLRLRTWEWTTEGEPDLNRPIQSGVFGRGTLHLPVRVYPASVFPYVGRSIGISVPRLDLDAYASYATTVVFPRPGDWVVAWRGHHPGAPDRPDRLILDVRVRGRRQGPMEIQPPPAARRGAAMPIAGAGVGGLLVAAALLERRRSGSGAQMRAPKPLPERLFTRGRTRVHTRAHEKGAPDANQP